MNKGTKLAIATGAILILIWAVFFRSSSSSQNLPQTITVQRGDIIRKALAVGRITVENEVPVKSTAGGILARQFVTLGQAVTRGTPIAEVRPVITTQSLVSAERSLSLAKDQEANAEEFLQGNTLAGMLTRWLNGSNSVARMRRQAELSRRQVEERLELLKTGQTTADGQSIDYNVLAPVDGHVLEIVTREGAPVVASSSYGSGTVLMILADLDRSLFVGTVDEIDVGRLSTNMTARISIGALPGSELTGKVTEIGLKSKQQNNASVFDVRIALDKTDALTLRSGYSATAEIVIASSTQVLVLPERVIRFEGDETTVMKLTETGSLERTPVTLGLSDGLQVEILSGVTEGDAVAEQQY